MEKLKIKGNHKKHRRTWNVKPVTRVKENKKHRLERQYGKGFYKDEAGNWFALTEQN